METSAEIPSTPEVTRLLRQWSDGDAGALERLVPLIYGELHRLAERAMGRERSDHTLQPTALLHEAYVRLVGQQQVSWRNRSQFFAVASQAMRRVLVDHARGRTAAKRGGERHRVSLEDAPQLTDSRPSDLLALDEALRELAEVDERKSRVVELRIFGGLTIPETAAALGVSTGTVIEEFRRARAWLYREIRRGAGGPAEDG